MGKKTNQLYAQMMSMIQQMQNQQANPAQNALTTAALEGADVLKKGDFSSLPKGMFFNFRNPIEQTKQYRDLTNVGDEGVFALGADNGKAMATQKNYLNDKFARDASQNYQDNIANAAANIQNALGQASGASAQNNAQILGTLGNLWQTLSQKPSGWGQALGMIGQLGSAAINKLPF